MPTPKHLLGVKGDECQCGRRATIRHCPSCGSARVYARQNRMHTLISGEQKFVEIQFRCQGCGHLFIDQEREFCEAPPVGNVLASQRVRAIHEAAKTGQYLRPADEKIADSLQKLMLAPLTEEQKKKEYSKLVYQLRVEYVDWKVEKSRTNEQVAESMNDYVARRLRELNLAGVESTKETENSAVERETPSTTPATSLGEPMMDVAERTARLRWGKLKLAGRDVPPVEEFVQRSLAGEIFE